MTILTDVRSGASGEESYQKSLNQTRRDRLNPVNRLSRAYSERLRQKYLVDTVGLFWPVEQTFISFNCLLIYSAFYMITTHTKGTDRRKGIYTESQGITMQGNHVGLRGE
jgi:hypothetical protein